MNTISDQVFLSPTGSPSPKGDIGLPAVRASVRPSFRPSVRPSVRVQGFYEHR